MKYNIVVDTEKDKVFLLNEDMEEQSYTINNFLKKIKYFFNSVEEIKIGDTVAIIDSYLTYTTYVDWFIKYEENELGVRYAYKDNAVIDRYSSSGKFKVKAIHKHLDYANVLCAIEHEDTKRIFLIDIEGLRKIG